MVLLLVSVLLFNAVAYKINKKLTKNQVVHIWVFTIILVTWADIYIDDKTSGYWYFDPGIDWGNFVVYTLLIPPVNIIFLNGYPFKASWFIKLSYIILWMILITIYELIALLPEPWGFFHYGWWHLSYSIVCDPVLLMILLSYYKWIRHIEKND